MGKKDLYLAAAIIARYSKARVLPQVGVVYGADLGNLKSFLMVKPAQDEEIDPWRS
jgi:hypothetical protein